MWWEFLGFLNVRILTPDSKILSFYWGQLDLSARPTSEGRDPSTGRNLAISFSRFSRFHSTQLAESGSLPSSQPQPFLQEVSKVTAWLPGMLTLDTGPGHRHSAWWGWYSHTWGGGGGRAGQTKVWAAGKLWWRLSLSSGELWAGVALGTVPTQSERLEPFQPHCPVGDVAASPPVLDKCPLDIQLWDVIAP